MSSFKEAVTQTSQGVLVRVHVAPGASHTRFPAGFNPWRGCVEIKVRSTAQENKANREVIETIARFFGLSAKDVHMTSGQKSREKTVCLTGISAEAVITQLEASFHG
jgi:uncharacterized protein (TIGR00251 family)